MRLKQALKEFAVIRDFEMQQFVHYNEFLKPVRLIEQLWIKCDASFAGAGSPFARHPLNSNLFGARSDF